MRPLLGLSGMTLMLAELFFAEDAIDLLSYLLDEGGRRLGMDECEWNYHTDSEHHDLAALALVSWWAIGTLVVYIVCQFGFRFCESTPLCPGEPARPIRTIRSLQPTSDLNDASRQWTCKPAC